MSQNHIPKSLEVIVFPSRNFLCTCCLEVVVYTFLMFSSTLILPSGLQTFRPAFCYFSVLPLVCAAFLRVVGKSDELFAAFPVYSVFPTHISKNISSSNHFDDLFVSGLFKLGFITQGHLLTLIFIVTGIPV